MKYILLLITLVSSSCKSPKAPPQSTAISNLGITFLDSIAAADQILTERHDGYFESLTVVDMAIQMHTEKRYDDRAKALSDYKVRLTTDVSTFTPKEKQIVKSTFEEAKRIISEVNPELWPNHIDLIKIKTGHYGPDVYYTREDAILIPENVLGAPEAAADLLPIMLHEIYHILSRYYSDFRKQTYNLISFHPHGKKIRYSKKIDFRRLTNPDGVTSDYAISLKNSDGEEQLAMPVLKSAQPYYSSKIPSFFAYVGFDLYSIEAQSDGSLLVVTDAKGNTTLSPEHQNDYFTHIGDNTQYVIHPEEIMADNFMHSLLANDTGDQEKFSESGKQLLDRTLSLLKAFDK